MMHTTVETHELVTLTYHNKAGNWTQVTYPVNRYAAERIAREHLRTYRTDTKISKKLTPGKITLRHRATGDTAVIELEEILLDT